MNYCSKYNVSCANATELGFCGVTACTRVSSSISSHPTAHTSKYTNADRIRAMSDEELAVFFTKVDAALHRAELDVVSYRSGLVNENLDWLKQVVE